MSLFPAAVSGTCPTDARTLGYFAGLARRFGTHTWYPPARYPTWYPRREAPYTDTCIIGHSPRPSGDERVLPRSVRAPTTHLVVREHLGKPFWEAKFREEGRQVKRRIGAAWLVRAGSTEAKPNGKVYKGEQWVQRRGRPPAGAFSYDGAVAAVPTLLSTYGRERAERAAAADAARREAERPRSFQRARPGLARMAGPQRDQGIDPCRI